MNWFHESYDEYQPQIFHSLSNFQDEDNSFLQVPPAHYPLLTNQMEDYDYGFPNPQALVFSVVDNPSSNEEYEIEEASETSLNSPRTETDEKNYYIYPKDESDEEEREEEVIRVEENLTPKKRKRKRGPQTPRKRLKSSFMILKERIIKVLNSNSDSYFTIKEITEMFSRFYPDYEDIGNRLSNAVHHLCKDSILEKKYVEVEKKVNRRGIAVVFRPFNQEEESNDYEF